MNLQWPCRAPVNSDSAIGHLTQIAKIFVEARIVESESCQAEAESWCRWLVSGAASFSRK
jgi:hypothetical protein